MAIKKKQTIVIGDSNIWISLLINPTKNAFLIDALNNSSLRFLICKQLLEEIQNVALREKFRKWFDESLIQDLMTVLKSKCHNLEIIEKEHPDLRDPKDNFIITLAEQGKADIIVTGDKDILDIENKLGKTKVIQLAQFKQFLENLKITQNQPC